MNKLPFIPNQVYKRKDIHTEFGGTRGGGISLNAKIPWIFIFSGDPGKQHGYKDRWENSLVFSYTGHGQVGDMKYTRGNLRLRDHVKNGHRVFLFEILGKGYVKFVSELDYVESDYFEAHDRNGDLRIAIKFFFKVHGCELPKNWQLIGQSSEQQVKYSTPDLFYTRDVIDNTKQLITESKSLVTTRVGQGAYRKSILYKWEYECAVTKFNDPRILIASHIVPWKDSTSDQRLDVENGILLSPTYDALFDQNLISFENSGKIILSDAIDIKAYNKIGVTGSETLKDVSAGMIPYLDIHSKSINDILIIPK